jgi:hypothetical protein
MHGFSKNLWFVFLILAFPFPEVSAQEGMGGGLYQNKQNFACLTQTEREEIKSLLRQNIQYLKEQGKITDQYTEEAVLFEWPIAQQGISDYGFHGISNFVDQDPAYPNYLLDYNCGNRTYDLETGYNHRGIDFFNWPFGWYKMDYDEVIVVAAAPGVIILKQDGNFDRNCGFGGSSWNAIYIRHTDGSVAWYGHMKNGSLTSKILGDSVSVGEYLGVVGSSGNSTAPHLHFENYNQSGELIEPFQGSCNALNSTSWWNNQRQYYDSAINKLMTHSAPPVFPQCPSQEIINEKNHFVPGERVYTAAYYRDQLNTQVSRYTVYRPDGSAYSSWTHHSNADHYSASYWYWYWTLPSNAQTGLWTFEVQFEGEIYSHQFSVGETTAIKERDMNPWEYKLYQNYPNPFNPFTDISFLLSKDKLVNLKIFNSIGQQIKVLVDEKKSAGRHHITWDGTNENGMPVPGGTYFYRIVSGDFSATKQMLLIK